MKNSRQIIIIFLFFFLAGLVFYYPSFFLPILIILSLTLIILLILPLFVHPSTSLTELEKAIDAVKNGNLNYRIHLSGGEKDSIFDHFNQMIIAVKKSQTAITNDLEKFKLAVDNTSDHNIITDPEGIVLYANKGFENITGYKISEMIGKKANLPISKKTFSGEINNIRKNGEKYISTAEIFPILDDHHRILYFVDIETDTTRDQEVDQMKSEFVSFASHQLRTPLTAMKWFAEMLLNGDAGKITTEQREFVQNMYSSTSRMIDLVKDLLDISRIESGRIIIEPKPTDLIKLVQEILVEEKVKLKNKQQQIIPVFNKKLPKVNLDPLLVRNVYLNLINNAIKYTPNKGKININISRKKNDILTQISDNGLGIPREQQSQVFQKFFRAANAVKIETEGSGLGLYLVKAIIESSGGKIWFDSIEGQGTTFWFSLPIKGVHAKKGEIRLGS